MCGIVGIYHFDPERPVVEAHVRAMADRIVHRGPDDAGYHVDRNVGLGMRRLSIIDVAGGHQPIFTPDGRYAIVFNGEVYNFREERPALEARGHAFTTHTDTEVVLHLYAEHGLKFLDRLNGMFGLAIWDAEERTLVIARDRIGIKPLYYYQDPERIVFGSEIKAILAHPDVRAELDLEGLATYLRYGFTPAPYTLFKGIRKLPPAHVLILRDEKIELREYWRLSYRNKFTTGEDELKEQLYDLLASSVRYQMIADVPLGAFLSGGFDSSGIVHLMSELGSGPVSTYSIGFGAGFETYNELEAAGRFARDYRTDHHEILVTPDVADLFPRLIAGLDEPVADSSFLVTYLVARLARETVTVILSGVGGDELFGGYRRYLNVTLSRYFAHLPSWARMKVLKPLLAALPVDRNSRLLNLFRLARAYVNASGLPLASQYGSYTTLMSPDLVAAMAPSAGNVPDYYDSLFRDCDADGLLDKMTYFDLKTSLPEQLLMLTDKMSMQTSLEGRVPYLDHRVVEFAAKVPERFKVNGFTLRHLQKETFRGRLPAYVFEQRKKGFGAPVGVWLRNELRPFIEQYLCGDFLEKQALFDKAVVARIVAEHYAQRQDHADSLLGLLAFQIWHSEYLSQAAG